MSEPSTHDDRKLADAIEDPFLRRSVHMALHLRRYMPFYVFGAIWILTLAAFPIIRGDGPSQQANGDLGASVVAEDGTLPPIDSTTGATPTVDAAGNPVATPTGATKTASGSTAAKKTTTAAGTKAGATGGSAGGSSANVALAGEAARAAIQRGQGKTRLGNACDASTTQIPGGSYAIPCQNVYDGPNGGATYRGVTDKEILIVSRQFPESANSKAVAEVSKQAGFADPKVTEAVQAEFLDYFNKAYELYGRKVNYVKYESENGDSTAEAQSKGKEGACLDADKIVKEMKAFAVAGSSQPFGDCAGERSLVVFGAAAYFPESYFAKYHPFLWNTTMECERIAHQTAEYMGKRLINKPAKYAGDPVIRAKTRKFGTYVPDNDGYQRCVAIYKKDLKEQYGLADTGPQYNYQLDVSRFPDQAAQAAVQFAAAGVTTVVLACDYISVVVLTGAASQQNWKPEWFTIGVGGVDLDNTARLYDQSQVNGHLFGLSQLGDAQKLIGPNSEPGVVYKLATGKTMPEGTSGGYHGLVHIFNMLQAAGPNLTPDNIAAGTRTIPVRGAEPYPAGRWSFADSVTGGEGYDHTEVQDAREVYWVSEPGTDTASGNSANDKYYNGADSKNGTFKVTYNGRRFLSGEWPSGDLPIYPPR